MNFRRFTHIGLLSLLVVLLGSCHGMWDEEGADCITYKRVRFTYDWNMLFADAFRHEVNTLTLYALDSDNNIVWSRTANTDSIIAKGYMDVSDIPSGKYKLQVWAQGDNRYDNTYTFGTAAVGDSQQNLSVRLNRDDAKTVDHDITPLYFGTYDSADYTDMPYGGVEDYTVNLMKDTENFRIVLRNTDGTELPVDSFRFFITDNNGMLDTDNNLVADDTLTYKAWSVYNTTVGSDSLDTNPGAITSLSSLTAELTTNRLVKGHNMRLHVTRNDGTPVIDLPLVDLCLAVKGMYNRDMSDQEYLDRQDTWNMVFFLDENRNWMSASVIINSWRVVFHNYNPQS